MVAAAFVLLAAGAAFAAPDQGTRDRQNVLRKQLEAHSGMSVGVKQLVLKDLLPMTANEVWVQAVGEQNAKNVPLQAIKDVDTSLDSAEDEQPIHRSLSTSPCAKEIVKLAEARPVVKKVFVLDNQGASVCQNAFSKTYWQGESEGWRTSYGGGLGGVSVESVQYDDTAYANLQEVSLPVIGANGQVIGAVKFAIAVDAK